MSKIIVAALYKCAKLPDYREKQAGLLDFCVKQRVYGSRGINGTVAGTRAGIDALIAYH